MLRRLAILIVSGIALCLMVIPTNIAAARTITFGRSSAFWQITVKACVNGFIVTAKGGTVAGVITSVKAVDAMIWTPELKRPFLVETTPLPFNSTSGSMLIASASNPDIQVIGTAYFYFNQPLSFGTGVQTTIEGYSNNTPLNIPGGKGVDNVQNCTVPQLPTVITDLSGVIIDPGEVAITTLAIDGRASPTPADHIIVYCLTTGPYAGNIIMNGINPNGGPYRLGQFTVNEVAAASPKGVFKLALDNHGEISLSTRGGYYVADWSNGPWSPYEQKVFTCIIDKSKYNKTDLQLKYPDTFGADGRVAPSEADRIAIYCRVDSGVIDIFSLDSQNNGNKLATFKYADVVAASTMVQTIPKLGTVSLEVDNDDNFYFKWTDGPYGVQTKAFKCRF